MNRPSEAVAVLQWEGKGRIEKHRVLRLKSTQLETRDSIPKFQDFEATVTGRVTVTSSHCYLLTG